MCVQGFYKAYNSKAHGGEISYREDEFGRLFVTHVFRDWGREFTVVKPVMLTMTCYGNADWPPAFYEPDTYIITEDGVESCELPFSIEYPVDTRPDPTETSTYFQCSQCSPGTFSAVSGTDQCNMCQPGTYQDQPGTTSCKPCPEGAISGDGMSRCSFCPMHSYQVENDCQACESGKFTTTVGASACSSCPPDTWSSGDTDGCKLCPAWSRSAGGGGPMSCICYEGLFLYKLAEEDGGGMACAQCAPGTFSTSASNVCLPCPSGTYGDRDAMGTCIPCPAGQAAVPGSTECVPCIPPQIPTDDGRVCQDCPKGMVCGLDGEVMMCPEGTYSPFTGVTSLDQCMTCPPNQVCSDPSVAEQCPPNTHSVAGATSMLQCECDYGFDCTYTKSLRGKVVLPVDPETFDTDMRQSFIQAIADAAGVSPDRVRIISVERVTVPSTRALSGTRPRRHPHKTMVHIRVLGATSLRKVDKVLQMHGFPRASVKTRVSWDHHVEVKRQPLGRRAYGRGDWI